MTNTEVKVENTTAPAGGGDRKRFRYVYSSQIKTRPKFKVETAKLDGVCFDCSDGNHTNNYSQVMRKVT